MKFKRPQLKRKRFKQRCGYIYQDLNYKIRGGWTLFYPILYQIRFMALVLAILYVENVVIQVEIILMMTVFVVSLLGTVHPYKEIRVNYTSMASEVVIVIIIDLLLFSTD